MNKTLGWAVAGFMIPIAFGCSPAGALIICLITAAIPQMFGG